MKLDEAHSKVLAAKAGALGKTPPEYLHSLIDADNRTFDDILEPVRQEFESMSDDEAEALLDRACDAARTQASGST